MEEREEVVIGGRRVEKKWKERRAKAEVASMTKRIFWTSSLGFELFYFLFVFFFCFFSFVFFPLNRLWSFKEDKGSI